MGDGFVIILKIGIVVVLVDGKIVNLFLMKYVLGIELMIGCEILIYVGIDIVNLKGEGFEVLVV